MDKYKEFYISSLESKRFSGWLFAVMLSLFTIALWIWGVPELWSLRQKISATIFSIIIVYGMGIREIKEANRELLGLR